MNVRFTRRALADIRKICSHIEKDSPKAATRVAARLFSFAELLGQCPDIGHAGLARRTMEWAIPGLPFIVIHVVRHAEAEVVILAIRHGAESREKARYDL